MRKYRKKVQKQVTCYLIKIWFVYCYYYGENNIYNKYRYHHGKAHKAIDVVWEIQYTKVKDSLCNWLISNKSFMDAINIHYQTVFLFWYFLTKESYVCTWTYHLPECLGDVERIGEQGGNKMQIELFSFLVPWLTILLKLERYNNNVGTSRLWIGRFWSLRTSK
jgi:hypothetical protein